MMFYYIFYYLLACGALPQYQVSFFKNAGIKIDGYCNEASWKKCHEIKYLHTPWHKNNHDSTRFRACYDNAFFYFFFDARDRDIITVDSIGEITVASGDRVEFFFSKDTSLGNYYCIEMSPKGKILDYQASYYRKFRNEWSTEGIEIAARSTGISYSIEGKIPISFFRNLVGQGDLKGQIIYTGIYRADKNKGEDDFIWHSWIDPMVTSPDFHISSSFGIFRFN